ncbi:MAG: phosphatidylserine decarboxylase, partial [Simkaniaceae bacterium]|nr:phosphatidylserine decarboxylase [Simkaniaceae bacterium]
MLQYIDRETKEKKVEKVYGGGLIRFLYGKGSFIRPLVTSFSLFSRFYGWVQKRGFTKGKIAPFIEKYGMDAAEFADQVESFSSFNDFFVRKLKPSARPIASSHGVMPADARYLFFPNISLADRFYVKGQKLNLPQLLRSSELAKTYENGTVIFARLCPVDYHRFHFPFDCVAGKSKLINGPLMSVNPLPLSKNIMILSQNKRVIT